MNRKWQHGVKHMRCLTSPRPLSPPHPLLTLFSPTLASTWTLRHTYNRTGRIIHRYTAALTRDPSSIYSNSATLDECGAFCRCSKRSGKARRVAFKQDLCSKSTPEDGVPQMSTTTTALRQNSKTQIVMCRGTDHEDKSEPIYAFQSQINVLKSWRTRTESTENGKKKRGGDGGLGPAEAGKLVNKQGGLGEQSNNISSSDYWYNIVTGLQIHFHHGETVLFS